MPSPLHNEITLLDFDYSATEYEGLRGKTIQVLAIPDLPALIPFVCENEWHKDDDHVRRGAIYVRSGTNTREAGYEQIQRILARRLEEELPSAAGRQVAAELAQLQALFTARDRALANEANTGELSKVERLSEYLSSLIDRKRADLEDALGFTHQPGD